MKANRSVIAACIVALAPCAALADKLGDHPAVVAKRLHAAAGYEYASKFYPHPAWLYLLPEAPRPENESPTLLVASDGKQARMEVPTKPAPDSLR